MWQSLAEDLFSLYYFIHVRKKGAQKKNDRRDSDGFRYGLSITFFIIIGDQLDRCIS